MNKKGGFTDLFIFIIISFIIVVISGVFIYLSVTTQSQLHASLDPMATPSLNTTAIIDENFGAVTTTFEALYWISAFIMIGMIISIFIGSYLVTTKPVFFIPYLFITAIAVVVSTIVSNAYEVIATNPVLGPTYAGFTAANFILSLLPMWVCIIGFVGAIIMFTRLGSGVDQGF